MDIAKNILHKYGWREGDGLGKNSDGIAKPIKANFKFNNSGLGSDPAKDHTNRWWERVFDEAASNLDVGPSGSIRQKEKDAVEISAKSYSVRKLKQKTADGKGGYGGFLKASTLLTAVGKEEDVAGHVRTEDIEFGRGKVLTDEELFAACGGRTAHKGARHGLKLSGKLARIEAQNNKLLQELESQSFEKVIKSNEWQQVVQKKKSKKKKQQKDKWDERHGEDQEDELKDMVHNADYVVKKNKKKAKADRRADLELADELDASMGFFEKLPEDDGTVPDPEPDIEEVVDDLNEKIMQMSYKLSNNDDEESDSQEKLRSLNSSSVTIKKKNKKKKRSKRKQASATTLEEDESMDPSAKYRKDYKTKQKQNNALLRETVDHEFSPPKNPQPKIVLKSSGSEDSDDDNDIVTRINDYRDKMKRQLPKIKVTEVVEEGQEIALAEQFKDAHRNRVKRVGRHRVKARKSKKRDRMVKELSERLEQNL